MIRTFTPADVLTLPSTIPELCRRGSPLWVTLRWSDGPPVRKEDASPVCIAGVWNYGRVAVQDGGLTDLYTIGDGIDDDVHPRDVALDLADPTGRFHAMLWLAEREFPAWPLLTSTLPTWMIAVWLHVSVKRVVKGGVPVGDLLSPWCPHGPGATTTSWSRTRLLDFKNAGGGLWVSAVPCVRRGWQNSCVSMSRWWEEGPEIGDAAKHIIETSALHAGFGLCDEDTLRCDVPEDVTP